MAATRSEELLKAGDPQAALKALQDEVRAAPADAKKRVFLFQLLCVLGQWERALNQLNVAAELDPSALAMAQTYREAIKCELLRAQVFEGRKVPMLFGEPEPWIALLIEALLREGQGQPADARALRDQAFEQAPAGSGKTGETPFAWIADADMRLGPVLEVIINGKYYWVPFARLARLEIEAPADLRDAVWMPAQLQFENGGETVGLIPTRYPGSEKSADGLLALARKTEWQEPAPGFYVGLGQRVLATDGGDLSLMDLRGIEWDAAPAEPAAESAEGG
ncbi:type VI secretion system accessory protein TagJ [Aquabacterium sp. A7-Y]|uniref:type VI secretion system accessory protein TagJ n=1 Tax=Aquabacterium sp. A7-Y TaxID=1349605 RepID=UPI00223D9CBC|nr:type VI secretion system accessory protein TagJ [Aquabacterium sp. A7-Y]MCW7540747.1 type VI secretion system accessory protein TagJ [Aquabacterium sp. A7-Y]